MAPKTSIEILGTRVVITADLHILKRAGLWAKHPEIRGDDLFAFTQIIDYCINNNASMIVLGDMFDSVVNMPTAVVRVDREIARLRKAGLELYYIQGNHEMLVHASAVNEPWLRLCGCKHLHNREVIICGQPCFAFDYFSKSESAFWFNSVPENVTTLLMHGSAKEVLPYNYHFSMDEVPDHVNMIFAGDYHPRTTRTFENNKTLHYPGSTYSTSIKGVDRVPAFTVWDGTTITSVPLSSRVFLTTSEIFDLWSEDELLPEDGKIDPVMFVAYAQKIIDEKTPLFEQNGTVPNHINKPVIVVEHDLPQHIYETKLSAHYLHAAGRILKNRDTIEQEDLSEEDELTPEVVLRNHLEEGSKAFDFTLKLIKRSVEDAIHDLRKTMGVSVSDLT